MAHKEKYPMWKNLYKRIGARSHKFLDERHTACGLVVIRIKKQNRELLPKCRTCQNLEAGEVRGGGVYDPYWTHIPTRSAA